jgi:isoquinoline 1-oxidoreductase subunit beta
MISGMRLMRVAEGAEGDTEIATPLLRVEVRASTALAFADALPARAADMVIAVVLTSAAHRPFEPPQGQCPVPRVTDMPQITVHVVPSAEPPTGMGEPGLPPLAPAFANAMARLTGKPLRQLPFTLA